MKFKTGREQEVSHLAWARRLDYTVGMSMRLYGILIILLVLAACQPAPQNPLLTGEAPFPTVTVGQQLDGRLPTPGGRPNLVAGQSNPATAAALADRATPTPDSGRCPFPSESAQLGDYPASRVDAIGAILQFLNDGGSVEALRVAIQSEWNAFGDAGYIQNDVDLTGEGVAEIILGYTAPGDVGTLLIFGCQAGRYVQLYEQASDGLNPPELLFVGESNNNPPAEVIYTRRRCSDAEFCELQTRVIGWAYTVGRFVSLLPDTVLTLDEPQVRDMDNDRVQEIIINLESNGNAATGPLRTGRNIYDWNGQLYVLSIIQLDEPRYVIQVVQAGDIAFSRLDMDSAISFYRLALQDNDLRYWFNDGPVNTVSYAQYRLILAYAYNGNSAGVIETLSQMNTDFPPESDEITLNDAPVYVHLANAFVDTLSQTSDLHASCEAVLTVIDTREEALDFINRYGSRSPTYTALDLCPY